MGWSWRQVASGDHHGSAVPSPNIPPCSTLPGLSVVLFLILGSLLTREPRRCWKPLCLVGRTPQPDSVPCPDAAGEDHFSTEPQKQKQPGAAPLAEDAETTHGCSAVAFGVDFTREIIAVGAGAFLERRSQLDLPNIYAVAVWANISMDLWACSSNFSFPPSQGLWFYVILLF